MWALNNVPGTILTTENSPGRTEGFPLLRAYGPQAPDSGTRGILMGLRIPFPPGKGTAEPSKEW